MRRINPNEDIRALSDFRAGVSAYVQQVSETKRPLVITQHGKGVAVLSDVGEFEAMQARLEMLEELYKAESQINEGRGISHEDAKFIVMKGVQR
ncbi:MAG: type II toxin-antitoxin system Phd/YefM family antitoxin [Motiliproteus sp.]